MTTEGWVTMPPTERVLFGRRAGPALADEVARLGARRVFLLVGSTLNSQTDEIRQIEAALGSRHAATWAGIAPHAPRSNVLAAASAARDCNADLIVTVGGGSVVDSGKIIPLLIANNARSTDDFDPLRLGFAPPGGGAPPKIIPPTIRTICIPTTLSGGEFNPLSGSTDDASRKKQGYEHPLMAPVSIILDPALTRHTPMWLWLSTGVRGVDHAVEALASPRANPFTDAMAASALRLLKSGLTRVKADPNDVDARLDCQFGAWQAMIPIIGGTPMGASHAIGHVLGGACEVPHGYTSCVMAPVVQAWNAEAGVGRQEVIAAALDAPGAPVGQTLDTLIRGLGMPRSLREVGVGEDKYQIVAEHTLLDIWSKRGPRPITSTAEVIELLRRADLQGGDAHPSDATAA